MCCILSALRRRYGLPLVPRRLHVAPSLFRRASQAQRQCTLLRDSSPLHKARNSCGSFTERQHQQRQALQPQALPQSLQEQSWQTGDKVLSYKCAKQLQPMWKLLNETRCLQLRCPQRNLHSQRRVPRTLPRQPQPQEKHESGQWQQKEVQQFVSWEARAPDSKIQSVAGSSLVVSDVRSRGSDFPRAQDTASSRILLYKSAVHSFQHKLARNLGQAHSKVTSLLSYLSPKASESSDAYKDASWRPGLLQLPGVHSPKELMQLARRTVEDCERFLATREADQAELRTPASGDEGQAVAATSQVKSTATQKKILGAKVEDTAPTPSPINLGTAAAAAARGGDSGLPASQCEAKIAPPVAQRAVTAVGADQGLCSTEELVEEARLAVQTLDAVSNALCKVADAAELLRQMHPDENWRSAASDVVLKVQEFMSVTNVNNRVYARLDRLAAAVDTTGPSLATPHGGKEVSAADTSAEPPLVAPSMTLMPACTANESAASETAQVSTTPVRCSMAPETSSTPAVKIQFIRSGTLAPQASAAMPSISASGLKVGEAQNGQGGNCTPSIAKRDEARGIGSNVAAVLSVEERTVLRSMRDAMQQQGVFLDSARKGAFLKLVADEAALAARIAHHMERHNASDSTDTTLAVEPLTLIEAGVPEAAVRRALFLQQLQPQRRLFFSRKSRVAVRRSNAPLLIAPDSELAHMVLKYVPDEGFRRSVFEMNHQQQQRDTQCEQMMLQLLALRQQRAHYAGYENWNAFAQRDGILKTPQAVSAFLTRVSTALQPGVQRELEVLADLKRGYPQRQAIPCGSRAAAAAAPSALSEGNNHGSPRTSPAIKHHRLQLLEPWDVSFYMHQYTLLSPCDAGSRVFPLVYVFSKLQEFVSRTMGLELVRTYPAKGETWHWSVLRFDLYEPAARRAFRLSASLSYSGASTSSRSGPGSKSIERREASNKRRSTTFSLSSASPCPPDHMAGDPSSASADCSSDSNTEFVSGAQCPRTSGRSAGASRRGVLYVDLWSRPNKPRLLAQFTLRGSKCFSYAASRGWSLGGPLWLSSVENLSDTLRTQESHDDPSSSDAGEEGRDSGFSTSSEASAVHTRSKSHFSNKVESITHPENNSSEPNRGDWTRVTNSSRCGVPLLRQVPCTALICSFLPPQDAAAVLADTSERASSAERDVETLLQRTRLPLAEVRSLLHEFGHAMHSLLSETALQHLSGTRGAVEFSEFPSLLFEHFTSPLFVSDTEGDHALEAKEATGGSAHKQTRCSFAHLQAAQMLLHALLDQGFYSYTPLPLRSEEMATGRDAELAEGGTAIMHTSTAQACEISSESYVSHDLQHLYMWLDKHYKKHDWLTEPVAALTSESVCKTLGVPRAGRFGHLVHYGGTYFSYLLCRAMASFVWQRAFAADPFSREAGQRLCAVLGRGSVDCSMRPVLEVAGPSVTPCERLQLLQCPALLPLAPFLHELTAEITASASLLEF